MTCVSNMKQLGMANAMYIDSQDGHIPFSFMPDNRSWFGQLWDAGATTDWKPILACPNQPRTLAALNTRFKGQDVKTRHVGYWTFSYGISRKNFTNNSTATFKGNKIHMVKNNSSKVAYGEIFLRNDYKTTGLDQPPDNGIGYYFTYPNLGAENYHGCLMSRHAGMTNVLWADWHVSTVRREQIWSVSLNTDIYNNYWNIKY